MNTQEGNEAIITGIPEHLRDPKKLSDEAQEDLGTVAVSGGRFGRGIIELSPEQVGPTAIRQAANLGTVEAQGGDKYVIPADPKNL